jgi:formamidopyrimidine-DNA glycosylase
MIELPEAAVLAKQINKTLTGKRIKKAIAAHTPHKFAWYFGDPRKYNNLLAGKIIGQTVSFGRYKTLLSKNTAGKPCPVCGTAIVKEAYLGGSIYYCSGCQKI